MVFSMTLRDFAKLCAISFSAQRNFLYSKRLILDPIDGPLSFSSFCLKCTKKPTKLNNPLIFFFRKFW